MHAHEWSERKGIKLPAFYRWDAFLARGAVEGVGPVVERGDWFCGCLASLCCSSAECVSEDCILIFDAVNECGGRDRGSRSDR